MPNAIHYDHSEPRVFRQVSPRHNVYYTNSEYTVIGGNILVARNNFSVSSASGTTSPDGWVQQYVSALGQTTENILSKAIPPIRTGGQTLLTATLAGNIGSNGAFSPGRGQYIAVPHTTTPFMTTYDWRTGSALSSPGTLPGGNGRFLAWSQDMQYVAVAHSTTPFITVYQLTRDSAGADPTFTKLTNPGTLPTNTGDGVAFSPPSVGGSNQYMAVSSGGTGTSELRLYDISGTTVTHRQAVVTGQTWTVAKVAWSPCGRFVAIVHSTSPFLGIYELTSLNTLTAVASTPTLAGIGRAVSWSSDSCYLMCSHDTSPFISIYARSDSTFTKLNDAATLPTGSGAPAAFFPLDYNIK